MSLHPIPHAYRYAHSHASSILKKVQLCDILASKREQFEQARDTALFDSSRLKPRLSSARSRAQQYHRVLERDMRDILPNASISLLGVGSLSI